MISLFTFSFTCEIYFFSTYQNGVQCSPFNILFDKICCAGSIQNPPSSMYCCIGHNTGWWIPCIQIAPWVSVCTGPSSIFCTQHITSITGWHHTLCLQNLPLTSATPFCLLVILACRYAPVISKTAVFLPLCASITSDAINTSWDMEGYATTPRGIYFCCGLSYSHVRALSFP